MVLGRPPTRVVEETVAPLQLAAVAGSAGFAPLGVNVVLYLSGATPEFTFECGVRAASVSPPRHCPRHPDAGRRGGAQHPLGAVRRGCKQHGRAIAGVNREFYGHWSDDPDELRTDLYYPLR